MSTDRGMIDLSVTRRLLGVDDDDCCCCEGYVPKSVKLLLFVLKWFETAEMLLEGMIAEFETC